MLPSLAKHVIMRLLFIENSVKLSDLHNWCFDHSQSLLNQTLTSLQKQFFILVIPEEENTVALSPIFQENLYNALVGGGQHTSFGQISDSKDKHRVDIAFLDEYSSNAWEAVLHYLVGTPSTSRPKAVMKLLEHSGLMARVSEPDNGQDADLRITNKGFQFLLQDVNVQVWAFLLQYLQMAKELAMDPVDVLNFLFQLGSLELGQDYSVDTLTETQKHMLDDLKHLGIIYQRKKKSSRFYPTRIATSLTSGSMVSAKSSQATGFIILETNFRVYAYTSSPLQIAVLSLFVSLKARFQNMIVGQLTRESVREAYANGITAEQIISYLTTHAHPEMRKQTPVLPSTVIDQIRLWEVERNRVTSIAAHMYKDFPREEDYKAAVKFASELGYVKFRDDTKRVFVVEEIGHQRMKEYFSNKKK
ncbi:RNA polymerase II transcription factor B 52 kDa subunit [Blyttiomyces sp. JEL0837]|nr:RNA polymerase II transcription factor B 52 kDa subunit [Blyttiomyces sp. JEL0837]